MRGMRSLLESMNVGKYLVIFLLLVICLVFAASFIWYRSGAPRPAIHSSGREASSLMKAVTSSPDTYLQSTTQIRSAQPIGEGPTTADTKVQVNGESIAVPQTGTVHKVIQNRNGTTTVDVSSSSSVSHTDGVDSSLNVNLNSTTESSSNESN